MIFLFLGRSLAIELAKKHIGASREAGDIEAVERTRPDLLGLAGASGRGRQEQVR